MEVTFDTIDERIKRSARVANLLSQLLKTLAHNLRTPLSVICNDLHYLSSMVGKDKCEIALTQCQKISEVISSLVQRSEVDFDYELIDLCELIDELKELAPELSELDSEGFLVKVDRVEFVSAIFSIKHTLERAGRMLKSTSAEVLMNVFTFEMQFLNPFGISLKSDPLSLLSELEFQSDESVIDLILVDSVLIDHGVTLEVNLGSLITITLKLPLCSYE